MPTAIKDVVLGGRYLLRRTDAVQLVLIVGLVQTQQEGLYARVQSLRTGEILPDLYHPDMLQLPGYCPWCDGSGFVYGGMPCVCCED